MRGYLHAENYATQRAFAVARELNEWLEAFARSKADGSDEAFASIYDAAQAGVEVSEATLAVSMGGQTVWFDQCDGSDDLTADFCRSRFAEFALPVTVVGTEIAAPAVS